MYGLSDETVKDLCSVFACYDNIEKVLLFGSRAKGNFREGSDIDLALFGKDITFSQILDIKVRIEDLLSFGRICCERKVSDEPWLEILFR